MFYGYWVKPTFTVIKSDNQVNIVIDAKLITEVKEAKSLSVIIDEQNENRFSHSYITRTSICIHFICVKYCSCRSIKNIKTVTSLNKHEVRLTLFPE